MSTQECQELIGFAHEWWQLAFDQKSSQTDREAKRAALIAKFCGQYQAFVLSRGWQAFDPVIRAGGARPETYVALCARLTQADAGQIYNWGTIPNGQPGCVTLAQLSGDAQLFVMITHFAEVGRGYFFNLGQELYPFLRQVAQGTALWSQIKDRFSAAKTAKEDREWLPS